MSPEDSGSPPRSDTSKIDRHAIVVLAGGKSTRMGGLPKPELAIGGRSLVRRVLDAAPEANPRIVVGDVINRGFIVALEDPPDSGPAYALRTGLEHVPEAVPLVAVMAADLPFLTPEVIAALCQAVGDNDGALLVDHHGHPQWLCGVWRRSVLAECGERAQPGMGMRHLFGGLRYEQVSWLDSDLPAWFDCDTPQALEYARRLDREFRRAQ